MAEQWVKYLAIAIAIGIVAIIIALPAASFRKLETDEVGIMYDNIAKVLKTEVKTGGLHSGPPGFKFIKFPGTFKTMEFDKLECLNKEGVQIELIVQFQYRAQIKRIRELILNFKDFDGYVKELGFQARASILDSCSSYNTTQFQAQRAAFQETVRQTVIEKVQKDLHTDITDLQVGNIQRPESYEKVVRKKESAKENIQVAINERPRALVEAQAAKEQNITLAQIAIEKAESEARVILSKAESEAQRVEASYKAEGEALKKIEAKVGAGPLYLLAYLSSRLVAENEKESYIGLDQPAATKFY